ncbi:MAG: hypothetical protein MZW92_10860 [Comamonadaceae bacterium]|nr:hypothetical protein [Comamonadaceae bacterium]
MLQLEKGDPWVYGALVNNIWSLSSDKQGGSLQQRPDPAVRQLQLPGRLLPDQRADRHGRLEGRQRPAVDRAAGRRRRQDLPPRQAAGEHAARRLLQRRASGRRRQLAAARAGAVHVPEVIFLTPGATKTGMHRNSAFMFTTRSPQMIRHPLPFRRTASVPHPGRLRRWRRRSADGSAHAA